MFKTKLIYHYWLNGEMNSAGKPTICPQMPSLSRLISEARNVLMFQNMLNSDIEMISITAYEVSEMECDKEKEILLPVITLVYRNDDKAMLFTNVVAEDLKCFFSK